MLYGRGCYCIRFDVRSYCRSGIGTVRKGVAGGADSGCTAVLTPEAFHSMEIMSLHPGFRDSAQVLLQRVLVSHRTTCSMSNFGAKLHGDAMLVKVERDVLRATPGQSNRATAAVAGMQHVSDQMRMQALQFIQEREALRRMAGTGAADAVAAIGW